MLAIHPDTKVGALLDAYPGIDEKLIEWVPAFSKLRNPILRRTVAKVATLEQAARVGGIGVRELVGRLREATRQGPASLPVENEVGSPGEAPAWSTSVCVTTSIDAEPMLATGVHPLGRVRAAAQALSMGEAVQLLSPFRPEPLLAAMQQAGFRVWSREAEPGRHETLITRA